MSKGEGGAGVRPCVLLIGGSGQTEEGKLRLPPTNTAPGGGEEGMVCVRRQERERRRRCSHAATAEGPRKEAKGNDAGSHERRGGEWGGPHAQANARKVGSERLCHLTSTAAGPTTHRSDVSGTGRGG